MTGKDTRISAVAVQVGDDSTFKVGECPLFSPKQPLRNTDLDSVSMSAFGQKQSFKFYAYACILTVNERLLSAISGHWRDPNT